MTTDVQQTESVLELVDQLEDMVAGARRLPLSASVVVNEDELLELVDRIRLGLPDELVQARHTLEDGDRVVAAAQQEAERTLGSAEHDAERMVREAREHASALVSQHHIVTEAQARADSLLADAEERATTVRMEADSYAREVMSHLEEQLTRAVHTVRRGLETLPGSPPGRRAGRRGRG
jgi:vacuolar-type H+-ATPase subunit H